MVCPHSYLAVWLALPSEVALCSLAAKSAVM